ncbi:MAG: hypothetical protein E7612_02725 [Ruminococcaceae bacterium]|nr:hypothetical protein [Oscillospiraceae bacterium]
MIFKLFGTALVLAFVAFLLKNFGWKGTPIFAAVAAILFISEARDTMDFVFSSIEKIGNEAKIDDALSTAIKVLGLGYLFGICADICRELGEAGIAKSVEVVGRVEIIAVVIPYFEEIIKAGIGLVK